jgi:hypothetical protein
MLWQRTGPSPLEHGVAEGDNPVATGLQRHVKLLRRVELFGNAAQNGR